MFDTPSIEFYGTPLQAVCEKGFADAENGKPYNPPADKEEARAYREGFADSVGEQEFVVGKTYHFGQ